METNNFQPDICLVNNDLMMKRESLLNKFDKDYNKCDEVRPEKLIFSILIFSKIFLRLIGMIGSKLIYFVKYFFKCLINN